ncbi:hypothetical protein PanWU01x14_155950 [Parasponia andersonii]|uniref:Uncharacterized protein n=1 Tax=Parasponia andersonii TaxID=3476 RepID=A0A2P5CGB0_PARAD|nr:hypothetical protein PanWU01x14_155950 [Parasponia andersonii]
MDFECQDISMVTTRGQDNIDRGMSSSQSGNQVEQLACLTQNILEQRMRQEHQYIPPTQPPQQGQDVSESTEKRFRKLQPSTFDGGFDELSRYAPYMVATNELKVDQFMQGLRKTIVRDLKSGGIRGVPFAQIADRALDTEQAEKDVLDEENIRRERQAQDMQRGFRPGFPENRGGQIQVQHP